MSFRINKALGYGLEISETESSNIISSLEKLEDQDITIFDLYKNYITAKYAAAIEEDDYTNIPTDYFLFSSKMDRGSELRKLNYYDFFITIENLKVVSQYSDGKPKDVERILLIVPPARAVEWHRVDDTMDYVTHFLNNEEPENTVTELKYSPYPYNDMVMNLKTGETFLNNHFDSHMRNYKQGILSTEPDKFKAFYIKYFAYYNVTPEESEELLTTAAVPTEIQDLLEAVGIVKPEENFTHRLKPMIVDYWE